MPHFLTNKLNWLLLLIFCLALVLRLWQLETLPATFFVDEVLSGYLGRYLWVNGVDLYGNTWPLLYFNKFGDYYIILPMYLDGLSTFLFGVTRFATRFPTALIGALAVFPLYGITRFVFQAKRVAYLSALLLAIAPWHIVLARATTESVLEMTVLLIAVWLLLSSVKNKSPRRMFLAMVVSAFSYLIYHTARIITPLIWLGFVIIFFKQLQLNKKLFSAAVLGLVLLFTMTFTISQTPWGKGRFEQTSIFSVQSGVSIRMQEMTYNLGNSSVLMARIFHNKVVGYGREFINQYLSYFSPLFLFADDAWSHSRYFVPEFGPLYLAVLLMLLSYLLSAVTARKANNQYLLFILWLLLIVPVPSSLTVIESPSVRRSLFMLVPLVILAAGGWKRAFSVSWKKITLGHGIALLLAIELIFFSYLYVKQSDAQDALYRSDGLPEIAEYIVSREAENRDFMVFDAYDFPLYYLFAKQDFGAEWSQQFQEKLTIESMYGVKPTLTKCARELLSDSLVLDSADTLYIEPSRCKVNSCLFEEVDQIYGVNKLIYFRVLKRKQLPPTEPECLSLLPFEGGEQGRF